MDNQELQLDEVVVIKYGSYKGTEAVILEIGSVYKVLHSDKTIGFYSEASLEKLNYA